MKKKFVIVSDRQKYGGTIVLHKLCKMLDEQGCDAKVFYIKNMVYEYRDDKYLLRKIKFWIDLLLYYVKDSFLLLLAKADKIAHLNINKTILKGYDYCPVQGCKRKYLPFVSKDTIVVYPDIAAGNFLHARNVIRWLLFYYKFFNIEGAYKKDDIFIAFRDVFDIKELNINRYKLCLTNWDTSLYRKYNDNKREGKCYIIRKGVNRADIPPELDGPVIDDWTECEKVNAFNKYKYCYLYDTQSGYAILAALCGCIPVVVLEEGKKKEDYISPNDISCGIAYGEDQIRYAIETRDELLRCIEKINQNNEKQIQMFKDICEKEFWSTI